MNTDNFQFHRMATRHHRQQRVIFGIIVILAGLLILGKKMGLFFFHFHVWPLLFIALGISSGIKHNFRNAGSWVLMIMGVLFMIPKFTLFGILSTHFVAPVLLILLGIFIILRPQRNRWMHYARYRRNRFQATTTQLDEDTVDLSVMFGERVSIVTSKNFKGGTVDTTFGTTKINLLQADSQEPMILDMKISFGSAEIVVPSHWDVSFQVDNSFASVEDQRYMRTIAESPKKLILRGSCSFGSIVVKSV